MNDNNEKTSQQYQFSLAKVRSQIKNIGLVNAITQINPGSYGMSVQHLNLLDVCEHSLVQILEVPMEVQKKLDPSIPFRKEFSNYYGLYIACQTFLNEIEPLLAEKVEVEGLFKQSWTYRIPNSEPEGCLKLVTEELYQFLQYHITLPDPDRKVENIPQLHGCLYAFFQLLSNTCKAKLKEEESFQAMSAISEHSFDFGKIHFKGLTLSKTPIVQEEEPDGLLDIRPEDIVGNKEFIKSGLRLARDIAGYDFEARQNPKEVNPVLFGLGRPGCGKTITAHAIGNYFLEYCQKRNIPASFVIIRRTDWASSYQNASAQNLIDIFKNKVYGHPGVVGVYWADIDTAFAARGNPGMKGEESNILGASFGIFDGTLIPKDGKWFLICDANTMSMDEATLSRISQDPHKVMGPTTREHFIELMRDIKLKKFLQALPLSQEEWDKVGDFCVENDLSGRNIDSICRKIVTEIQDVEPPDEYYQASFDRRQEILMELAKPIPYDQVLKALQDFIEFEQAAQEQAEQELFDRKVQEITLNLSAQKQAYKELESPTP